MPVEIPKVQRIAPQPPASVGRIETQIPDASRALASTSNQLVRGAGAIMSDIDRAERAAIDVEAVRLTNQYKLAYKEGLYGNSETNTKGLKDYKGAPAEAFNSFDLKMEKIRDDIMSSKKNASPRAKAKFEAAIYRADNSLQLERVTLYGQLSDRYDKSVIDNAKELNNKSALSSVGYIDPSDKTTFAPFESNLNENRAINIERSNRVGLAKEVSMDYKPNKGDVTQIVNGKRYLLDDSTVRQIAEEESKTVYEALNLLLSSDTSKDFETAKSMMELYGDRLGGVDKAKINKKFSDVSKSTEAYNIVSKLINLSPVKAQKEIDKLKNKDPELWGEVLKVQDSVTRQRENAQKRASTQAYEEVANKLINKMESSNPYSSWLQAQNDPSLGYKQLSDTMTARQRQALQDIVISPKTTNQQVFQKALQNYADGLFKGLPASRLAYLTRGLSKSDRGTVNRLWTKANDETISQEYSREKRMFQQVRAIGINNGILKVDGKGNLTKKSEQKLREMRTRALEEFEEVTKNASPQELLEFSKGIVGNQARRDKEEQLGFIDRLKVKFGIMEAPKSDIEAIPNELSGRKVKGRTVTEPIVPKANLSKLTATERKKAFEDYKKSLSGKPASAAGFKEYLRSKGQQ